jgi:hypothetical protein
LAGTTRLELATSGVTGRRSNQLNYAPGWWVQSSRLAISRLRSYIIDFEP